MKERFHRNPILPSLYTIVIFLYFIDQKTVFICWPKSADDLNHKNNSLGVTFSEPK